MRELKVKISIVKIVQGEMNHLMLNIRSPAKLPRERNIKRHVIDVSIKGMINNINVEFLFKKILK